MGEGIIVKVGGGSLLRWVRGSLLRWVGGSLLRWVGGSLLIELVHFQASDHSPYIAQYMTIIPLWIIFPDITEFRDKTSFSQKQMY